jgi:hypothetical protein
MSSPPLPQIIKKLQTKETLVYQRGSSQNFIVSFRLQSKRDLFSNLHLLDEAIQDWKKGHKLLRAKVASGTENTQDAENFYFVSNENDTTNNVHFLRIKYKEEALRKQKDELAYDLLMEKCLTEYVGVGENENFLWRLILLQVQAATETCTINETYCFEYELFMQYHQTIADGTCAYQLFLQLLDLIEKKLLNADKKEIISSVLAEVPFYPGPECVFASEINSGFKRMDIPFIARPNFVDPQRASQNTFSRMSKLISGVDVESFELVEVDTGKTYATFAQLLQISKELCNIRLRRFIVGEDIMVKLLKRYLKNILNIICLIKQ